MEELAAVLVADMVHPLLGTENNSATEVAGFEVIVRPLIEGKVRRGKRASGGVEGPHLIFASDPLTTRRTST